MTKVQPARRRGSGLSLSLGTRNRSKGCQQSLLYQLLWVLLLKTSVRLMTRGKSMSRREPECSLGRAPALSWSLIPAPTALVTHQKAPRLKGRLPSQAQASLQEGKSTALAWIQPHTVQGETPGNPSAADPPRPCLRPSVTEEETRT